VLVSQTQPVALTPLLGGMLVSPILLATTIPSLVAVLVSLTVLAATTHSLVVIQAAQ
jgi:uncharacterized membrane protein